MLRLHVLSDLHREFAEKSFPQVDADLVILAGDTDRGVKGVRWAKKAFGKTPVIYLAGNHEHYGERIGRLHEKLQAETAGSNVVVLENDTFEIAGYRIFGATLWTDFNLLGDRHLAMVVARDRQTGMNDFRKIRMLDGRKAFTPEESVLRHTQSARAIAGFLAKGDPTRSIVVTHHAPSARSLKSYSETKPISAAYASNLEALIHDRGPALWIHGHIHEARDYTIGKTRVLSNPQGYMTRTNPEKTGFKPELIVELP